MNLCALFPHVYAYMQISAPQRPVRLRKCQITSAHSYVDAVTVEEFDSHVLLAYFALVPPPT